MFSCIFDLFYPWPPGPTFDLFLTFLNCFGASGPLARPQFHNASDVWSISHRCDCDFVTWAFEDWTTGVPDNGNQWRKFCVVPRLRPLCPLVALFLKRVETEGVLDYQGRAGVASIARWNLHPVVFGVEESPVNTYHLHTKRCLRALSATWILSNTSHVLDGAPKLPLGPKWLHCITLFFRINFPDYVILFYIAELALNYFPGCVISCVVAEHTMWTWDCITELCLN